MAFPIIPKRRSGSVGNPTTLQLGELAVNTATGKLYLGADAGVAEIGVPVAAGTTVTETVGDGTTVAFAFGGYNGTDDSGYLVSVGGIDQPPSKYSISSAAGGTLTFSDPPKSGEIISIRAIVAGSGGGGSGNATQIQGRDVATTAPTAGQVLAWDAGTSKWKPTSLNGSVNFSEPGTHSWAVPAWVRWVYVQAAAGNGEQGVGTDGQPGQYGQNAYFDTDGNPVAATTGAQGANGESRNGIAGKSISVSALGLSLAGGAGGAAGIAGYGGGGGGGAGASDGTTLIPGAPGGNGAGPYGGGGGGGGTVSGGGIGGVISSDYGGPSNGGEGGYLTGGSFGIGSAQGGGRGGAGGASDSYGGGGGAGGATDPITGANSGGGGGGGGGRSTLGFNYGAGTPGFGGNGILGDLGGYGATAEGPYNLTAVAGTTIAIIISEGAGNASLTITW